MSEPAHEGWALEDRGYPKAKVRHYWIPCDPPAWAGNEFSGYPGLMGKQWYVAACGRGVGGITANPLKFTSRARRCAFCNKLHPEEGR